MRLVAKIPASWCFLLGLMLSLLPAPAGAAAAQPATTDIDRIVVIVNDDVITESELARRLTETKKQLALENIKIPPDDILRKQLLDRMVLERLELQLAKQTGIHVSDADVDRAFETLAQRNKLNVEDFRKAMTSNGIDVNAFRAQLRDQITIQHLLEREINNRISVSDSEVNNFLENRRNLADMGLAPVV